ncbi:hypothetical protein MASR2M29_04410 [Spirochaetota bacterium]
MPYTRIVKLKQNLFLWIIVIAAFPLLGFLAWNQFNWLEELQKRERFRIESAMFASVQEVSKRLKEELLFLPSLLRFRPEEQNTFEKAFAERWQFWNYYAEVPSIIKQLYLYFPESDQYKKWSGTEFVKTANPADPAFAGRMAETENSIIIAINSFAEHGARQLIFCVFDKNEIFHTLIPEIAEHSFSDSANFSYRIIDAATDKVLWTDMDTGTAKNSRINRKAPDFEMPLVKNLPVPVFQQSPSFSARTFTDLDGDSFAFIKERPRIEAGVPPEGILDHVFLSLKMQIYNNEGSIADLVRKASAQNAFISFGSVLLLFFIIILLAHTGQNARRLAERQKEFIATITHELKTPLAVILSAAQNLSDGLIKEQKKAEQYGVIIQKEAERLGVSVEHFLLYSRTGTSSRIKPERIDVSGLVKTALGFTEAERQALSFRTEVFLPDHPVYIHGDRIALESVLQNLIRNVLVHAKDGKYLSIIASMTKSKKNKQGKVSIKIRDKGPGISAKEQKHVFEPFVRGKNAHNLQIPGNGIGLNLVQRILAMHNGSITIDSRPGNGCVFTISLPIMPEAYDG